MKKEKAFYIPFQAHVSDRLWREINKQKLKHIIYGQKEDWWRLDQVKVDKKHMSLSREGDKAAERVQWVKRMVELGVTGYVISDLSSILKESLSRITVETIKKDLRKALSTYRWSKEDFWRLEQAYLLDGRKRRLYQQALGFKSYWAQQVADLTLQLASME